MNYNNVNHSYTLAERERTFRLLVARTQFGESWIMEQGPGSCPGELFRNEMMHASEAADGVQGGGGADVTLRFQKPERPA
jgi:hypothetical protein